MPEIKTKDFTHANAPINIKPPPTETYTKQLAIRTKDAISSQAQAQVQTQTDSENTNESAYATDSVYNTTEQAADKAFDAAFDGFNKARHRYAKKYDKAIKTAQNGERVRSGEGYSFSHSTNTSTSVDILKTAKDKQIQNHAIKTKLKSISIKNNIKNSSTTKNSKYIKYANRTVKSANKTIGTAKTAKTAIKTQKTAAQLKHAATKSAQAAKQAAKTAQLTAKAATKAAALAAKWTAAMVKAAVAAVKSLVAAIAAGGWIAVLIIAVLLMVGLLVNSSFGIFFSDEWSNDTTAKAIAEELSAEHYERITEIENSVQHDYVHYTANDGRTAIPWVDIFAVYSARETMASENANEVVTFTDEKKGLIRHIMFDMSEITYRTEIIPREVTTELTDENGEIYTETEILEETHLTIEITNKTAEEMAVLYGFNSAQNEQLSLLTAPEYEPLWVDLLGATINGTGADGENGAYTPSGEILPPGIAGSGAISWPLSIASYVNSPFGYREHPITGEWDFHRGIDMPAPYATPILAAADGTVTVANATDSWGYSWGYYVKINHGNGMTTLYAHCSSVAVRPKQQVKKGEVIAYVGSTGGSTGNHLHFEVEVNGQLVNGENMF